MKTIVNWSEQDLTCSKCGETRSVKWEHNEKSLCNKCVIPVVMEEEQAKLTDK